ncbi:conjugal transfer protein TraF [Azotobacter sp. CWF10]
MPPLRHLSPIALAMAMTGQALAEDRASPLRHPTSPAPRSPANPSTRTRSAAGSGTRSRPSPSRSPFPLPPPAGENRAAAPEAAPAPPAGPAPGSVAWVREVLPKLREAAIDNPSDENIQAYYYAQRLMMDKSERFSRRSMEVIRNDPFLDEDLRYPASNAASDALASAAGRQKETLLKMIAGNAGIVFFFKGEQCPLCEQAVTALAALEHRYGFTVIPVSLDGKPLPSGAYPTYQTDTGLADRLGVITAPAMALAVPPHGSQIISYSTVAMETATSRILNVARQTGLISAEEYNATSRLASIGLIDSQAMETAPPDIAEDHKAFVKRMREAARRAYLNENGGNP